MDTCNEYNLEDKNKCLHNLSMVESDPDLNKSEIYNKWANSYDDYVSREGYVGPSQLTEQIIPLIIQIMSETDTFRDLNILDFGCGTGLLGIEINKFLENIGIGKNMIGIDISEEMINKAKLTGVYSTLLCQDIISTFSENVKDDKCSDTEFILENKGEFDLLISCGVFLEGHVSLDRVNDVLLPLVRSSGVLAFTVRSSFLAEFPNFFEKLNNNPSTKTITKKSIKYLDGILADAIIIKVS